MIDLQRVKTNSPLKSKNSHGFTLVEVIVVLVILAVLAAILVPRLTGWIDQTREKAAIGEAHLVLSAAQAAVDQAYANGNSEYDKRGDVYLDMRATSFTQSNNAMTFKDFLGADFDAATIDTIESVPKGNIVNIGGAYNSKCIWSNDCAIQPFIFRASNDYWVLYNGTFTASEDKPTIPRDFLE